MLGPALSWLGCCGGAGLGGKGGGERRWRDPKWAPGINIMPCDLPHIMIMIIYTSVCYDSIAITSYHYQGKEGRGEDPSFVCSWQCFAFCFDIYLFMRHEYFITKFFINSIDNRKRQMKGFKDSFKLGRKKISWPKFLKMDKRRAQCVPTRLTPPLMPWLCCNMLVDASKDNL